MTSIHATATFQQSSQIEPSDIDNFFFLMIDRGEPGSEYLTLYSNKQVTTHQHIFNITWLCFRLKTYNLEFSSFYNTNLLYKKLKNWNEITPQLIADSKNFKKKLIAKIQVVFDVSEEIKSFWFEYTSRQNKIKGLQLAGFLYLLNVKYELRMSESESLPMSKNTMESPANKNNAILEPSSTEIIKEISFEKSHQQYLILKYREQQKHLDKFEKALAGKNEAGNIATEKEPSETPELDMKKPLEEIASETDFLIKEVNEKSAKLASEIELLRANFELIEANLMKPIRFDENIEFDISHLNSILRNGLENGDFFISGKLNVAAVLEALRLKLKSKLEEDMKKVVDDGIQQSLNEHELKVSRLHEKIKKIPDISSSEI